MLKGVSLSPRRRKEPGKIKEKWLIYLNFIPALVVVGTIFYLSSRPAGSGTLTAFPLPAKPGHFVGYFALSAALYWGFSRRSLDWHPIWAMASWLVSLLVAFSDEFLQSFVPGRYDSVFDVFLDAAGAGTALILLAFYRVLRERVQEESKEIS